MKPTSENGSLRMTTFVSKHGIACFKCELAVARLGQRPESRVAPGRGLSAFAACGEPKKAD